MMRSLFAGVSGLQNHQIQMDVIGNNIANINTVGFKAGRVTFEESLTQLLQDASRPRSNLGGTNPRQVGLGSAIASIDTNFSQGNLETTGIMTDLAIQGSAFFVVKGEGTEYYTRAGNFVLDGEGRLVSPKSGFIVQGMLADLYGEVHSSAPVQDIVLPFGQKSPARATTKIDFFCNLDANSQALAQTWSGNFGRFAEIEALAAPGSLTINAANDTLAIEVNDGIGGTNIRTLTLSHDTYASVSGLVAEINAQIARFPIISGDVIAEVVSVGGVDAVRIRTTETGGTSTTLELTGNACANLNLASGVTAAGTSAADALNDLPFVGVNITNGDIFNITGINPNGTVVNHQYIYSAGDTVQDLLNELNEAYSGATAVLNQKGEIQLVDALPGSSQTLLTITFRDDDASGSSVNMPSFNSVQNGRDGGTHTASVTVYDSKGGEHNVAMRLVNISSESQSNIWSWEAIVNNGDIAPTTGNRGTVRFNPDGSLAVFSVDSGQPLTFEPGAGADTVRINLGGGNSGQFDGMTQLSSPTTTVAKYQDGYGMGNLQDISINNIGEIYGHFSNGISQALAQIVLAEFNNPSGLLKHGDSMYSQSANSGTPIRGRIGGGLQGSINSGALEMSNVDMAKEFTEMIISQRGFQASARVITTASELLQEIVQLKR